MDVLRENLKGRTAVITGGGGILCGAFARGLARHGVRCALLDINLEKARHAAECIKEMGGDAAAFCCDVLDKDSVSASKEEIIHTFGDYHILINGAGGNHLLVTTVGETASPQLAAEGHAGGLSFFDLDNNDITRVFGINFNGIIIPTQVFTPKLAGQTGATIINVSSMSAYYPLTKIPVYSAAKAAVSNLTMWLACYLADAGIRVNAIAPGFFETAQNKDLLRNADGTLTERSRKILAHTPMMRFGIPEDLLGTLLWLCNEDESGFVTGTIIPVDGGFLASSGI